MQIPEIPHNERQRLKTLHALQMLDTAPEARFDRITCIARRLFDVQIALVSLVDGERQWFKSVNGVDMKETRRDISFCGHAILQDDVLVVPDALEDPRFHDNPLVLRSPHTRFYAGCPLTMPSGHKLGTLCLMDRQPRMFSKEDRKSLRDLADIVVREMVSFNLATMDELTGVPNRRGFDHVAKQALNLCRRIGKPASMVFFDLNHFKAINDRFGHAEGDRALAIFADVLMEAVRDSDPVGRLGGDEFAALLIDAGNGVATEIIARLRLALKARASELRLPYVLQFSVGIVEYDASRYGTVAQMKDKADQEMYIDKSASRQRRSA
ncbi:diguanylate cyclase [Pseudoduganella sp. FT26W]|uniref:Diguanylate cyclase n=1 Tax=Duganella aquatilis TaxID=2666082 RepID=A0A844CTF2_9BURK|nr:sensor domain-containing diguanylate cyclase [Duganella aquatilis]MRW84047.1 diguanylate cyclase [Duganella aquatilis]